MTVEIFDAHLLVPAALHDAGNADGIVAIALVDLQLQGRFGMTRIDADDRQPLFLQLGPQPVRCRAGLEADPGDMRRMFDDECGDRVRIGSNHTFSPDLAGLIDNAHGRLPQRDVQSDIVLHRLPP